MNTDFFTIAHADHIFCNPISVERAGRLVDLLEFPPVGRVLDVGCGKGRLLLDIVQKHGVHGVGIDPNVEFLAVARAAAERRGLSHLMEWHEANVADVALAPASFEAALCVGSSHAFGTPRQALDALAALVVPGGQVLMGEGYWQRKPDPAYLEFLGASESEYLSHGKTEASGLAAGLVPLYSCTSSRDEWDDYEGLYCRATERFARNFPQDANAAPFRERIRKWRDGYRRWGRDTLGFGFYLFSKP